MTPEERKRQALSWFVRMNSGEATASDRSELAIWLADCPENREEYARLQRMWSDLDHARAPALHERNGSRTQAARLSRRGLLGAGAMLAAAGAAAWMGGATDYLYSDQFTSVAEIGEFTLDDGTRVTLDADSALSLDYTASRRGLVLHRGRAYFDVARDEARPFSVAAAGGTVTALGTQFVVHLWEDAVTASVQESAVSVVAPNGAGIRVNAGEVVSFSRGGLGLVEGADTEAETAWRRGRLIFEDKPLGRVVSDVNRYRRGTIRILDDRLRNLRVSGIFDVGNPDGVLDAIVETLPVRAFEITPYVVLLLPA
ncbi:FecR family protein [Rhizobium sp. LC145]|uniref:FecR family protein n=1 Tax=Rhizobium sp. LC145 TaxID=1120688 RepID=UPI001FD877CF|nr:FecR family protein [Rhizobium sp. LC145]